MPSAKPAKDLGASLPLPNNTFELKTLKWCLHLLIEEGGHRYMFRHSTFVGDEILDAMGIPFEMEQVSSPLTVKTFLQEYRQQLTDLHVPESDQLVLHNVYDVAAELHLTPVQTEVLLFLVVSDHDTALRSILESFQCSNRYFGSGHLLTLMKGLVNCSMAEMNQAFNGKNGLWQSGLMFSHSRHHGIELAEGLSELLHFQDNAVSQLIDMLSSPGQAPQLCRDNFKHINGLYTAVVQLLSRTTTKNGLNILIYGAPGTGKTEFVRQVCQQLGQNLREVATIDNYLKPHKADRRFASYSLLQNLLGRNKRFCILFDESESVFEPVFAKEYKAWINTALEENPLPCFWLSNDIQTMDPAFIRRFDLVIEMPSIPAEHKRALLSPYFEEHAAKERTATNDTATDSNNLLLEEICRHPALEIAHINRAIETVKQLGIDSEINIIDVLNGYIKANGYKPLAASAPERQEHFDLDLLNADMDMGQLLEGLRQNDGRVCLYGPPGTGKSAFVRYLAKQLGKPLHTHHASTLLGKYVGETEQNIKAAFDKASRDNAILFIDEADSFLQKRESASQSWEVSQVNELLVQMEKFTGTLMLATNLFDNFDTATLRRLDLKIKFDYLTQDQTQLLISRVSQDERSNSALPDIPLMITPGDVTAVQRKLTLLGRPLTRENIEQSIQSEMSHHQRHKRAIGFIH